MAKTTKKTAADEALEILAIDRERMQIHVLGTKGIICNRMSEKVWRELLMPRGKKTAADKATTLKHDPMAEFLASPYTDANPKGPTWIQGLGVWFKRAMQAAALDMPGSDTSKAEIGRLCWAVEERVPIWGIPQIYMAITRSKDMNRTPDVRTRAIVPSWATKVTIEYATPRITEKAAATLLAAAGAITGVGDWRAQKGSNNHGSFELVNEDDPRWQAIVQGGGRAAQLAAMETPVPYDDETAAMLQWFGEELERRGRKTANGAHLPVEVSDEDDETEVAQA